MKKFLDRIFGRSNPDEMPSDVVAPPEEPLKVIGISEADWYKAYNSIVREINEAKGRQKTPSAAPTAYMRGLIKALKILDAVRPYNILGVK